MQGICKNLEKEHKVKTRTIVCDFSEVKTIQEYRSVVADKVADLDLGMVFLNAGTLIPG